MLDFPSNNNNFNYLPEIYKILFIKKKEEKPGRQHFEILPSDLMLSAVHCGIHISFPSRPDRSVDLNVQDTDTQPLIRAIWDKSKHDSFLQNLNNEEINHFICHMNSLEDNVTKEIVELLTSQCTSLLYNAADAADAAGMIKCNDCWSFE